MSRVKRGLATHLDGARLFNAAVALGGDARAQARAIASHFDSVSVCFSKGLGAPVGSALVGSRELIARAHRWRKMLGGGMRQAGMLAAVRTILLADLVMSLDNVIAVAATAQGNMVLLVLGLAISIPLVIFGSTLMIKLMERFPVIVVLGAALIGWVGGETIVNDNILHDYAIAHPWLHYVAAAAGAILVVAVGKFVKARNEAKAETAAA